MSEKHCKSCDELLPFGEFHVDMSNVDGRHSTCKLCRKGEGGQRYTARERKANREFSAAMARVPAFNFGLLRWQS